MKNNFYSNNIQGLIHIGYFKCSEISYSTNPNNIYTYKYEQPSNKNENISFQEFIRPLNHKMRSISYTWFCIFNKSLQAHPKIFIIHKTSALNPERWVKLVVSKPPQEKNKASLLKVSLYDIDYPRLETLEQYPQKVTGFEKSTYHECIEEFHKEFSLQLFLNINSTMYRVLLGAGQFSQTEMEKKLNMRSSTIKDNRKKLNKNIEINRCTGLTLSSIKERSLFFKKQGLIR